MQKTRLIPPHAWVGGKRKLSKDIISLMPSHSLYVEVFGGGLSVLYAKDAPTSIKDEKR
jgi:DNA adenine methylase